MVDAIKTTVNRLELTKGRANDSRPANAGAPAAAGPSQVDDVMVARPLRQRRIRGWPRHHPSMSKPSVASRMRSLARVPD